MREIDGDLLTDIINETIEETKLLNRSVVTQMVIDFYRDFITIIERQPTVCKKDVDKVCEKCYNHNKGNYWCHKRLTFTDDDMSCSDWRKK